MTNSDTLPLGYKWRSATWFIIGTMCIALFAELFLYGFVVPILPYIFEKRLRRKPTETQGLTSAILALHGYVATMAGPIVGHFADKTPYRKTPLVLSLMVCIVGTVMTACAQSLVVLFIGRVLQSAAGSVVWISGLATVADSVSQENLGKAMGVVMSFTSAGMIGGPMASGLLLELAGYWATWSVPVVVLVVDIFLRVVMIENVKSQSPSTPSREEINEETEPLLTNNAENALSPSPSPQVNFWKTMFLNRRVVIGLVAQLINVSVTGSFHATLPLHVREVFGWSPSLIGVAFTCLTVPGLFIGPLVGWIRDRVGVRVPTTIAFTIQATALCLLGAAGNAQIPWLGSIQGPALYTAALVFFGIARTFSTGVATFETTAVVKEYQEKQPGIFGPGGGLSRVFSMVDVSGALGLTIGPIIGGALVETVGYGFMNLFWAVLSYMLAILVLLFSGSRLARERDSAE